MLSNFNKATRFDKFMYFALYDTQYGYYTRGKSIFGQGGDFTTAPELGSLFGKTLGLAIQSMLAHCKNTVYEFGAGTGQLACDLLSSTGELIEHYYIIEVSGALRKAQREKLIACHGSKIEYKVHWLNELPDELNGIVLGNEVLDAIPVRRFKWHHNGPLEAWVQRREDKLHLLWKPADAKFAATVHTLQAAHGPWPQDYESEIAEQSAAWVSSITERLHGMALMIDYGYHAAQYYHPNRTQGTLRATRRHTAHQNFLEHVGMQDLTAHVNFSAVYSTLNHCGGALEGYCHQGEFLLAHNILELASQTPDFTHPRKGALTRQNLNILLSQSDMGEVFKVIAWSKGVTAQGTQLGNAFLKHDRSGNL